MFAGVDVAVEKHLKEAEEADCEGDADDKALTPYYGCCAMLGQTDISDVITLVIYNPKPRIKYLLSRRGRGGGEAPE